MSDNALTCTTSQRRHALRQAAKPTDNSPGRQYNGIEFVEFEANGGNNELRVYFLCGVPIALLATQFELYSPMLRTTMPVTRFDQIGQCPDSVILTTASTLCDGAEYVLTIRRPSDFDPQFARYRFTAHSTTVEIDPKQKVLGKHCSAEDAKINYLARDYASFRQMLLDRLAQTVPGWKERHVPDIGITLVELFAYVGDYLAYYQDAVATEAYLNTARQRISVKRHTQLVDYQLHEGCNARAFLHLNVTGSDPVVLNPDDIFFITQHPDSRRKNQAVLGLDDLEDLPPNSVQPFEIMRWEPRCRELECDDIKNIVGLMAALVLHDRVADADYAFPLAGFLWKNLPQDLKAQLEEYATTGEASPDQSMIDSLLAALNRIMQQHCLDRVISPEGMMFDNIRTRMSSRLESSQTNVEDNKLILTKVFRYFFSRMDDSLIELHPGQNEMRFYTWDQSECHLPIGTTQATLCDDPECKPFDPTQPSILPPLSPSAAYEADPPSEDDADSKAKTTPLSPYVLAYLDDIDPGSGRSNWNLRHLSVGDILIFEETVGPKTHNPADANPMHRQAVRLTRVNFSVDPVSLVRVVEIEWDHADALTFSLCISSIGPVEDGCRLRNDVSIAHGNVILVDHGRTLEPEWIGEPLRAVRRGKCGDSYLDEVPPPVPLRSELFRPTLREVNLTFAESVAACSPASKLLLQEPHKAIPSLQINGFPVATEPEDSYRDDDVPPPTLVRMDDLADPLRALQRIAEFDETELRRLENMLPPHAARFLQEFRSSDPKGGIRTLINGLIQTNYSDPLGRSCSAPDAVDARVDRAARKNRLEASAFADALKTAVTWTPKLHLLDSDSEAQDVVVEITNDRQAHLRFGDDDLGRRPTAGTSFYARYRVGNGVNGNVGADRIRHVVFRTTRPAGINSVRNPLPAAGGKEPESMEHAKVHAPSQYKKLRRAITADDYAVIAMREFPGEIQQARAMLNWMGTWYQVSVAIDPMSSVTMPMDLVKRVQSTLENYRRIGHLLKIDLPRYVGLDIEMVVCVRSNYLAAHVRQELMNRFSSGVLEDGSRGFFHPDNFGFADSLYLSQIIAEAKKVQGVENVDITRFQKKDEGDQGERDNGVMNFGSLEIPRLDNDPLRPEAGCFCLRMEGSR